MNIFISIITGAFDQVRHEAKNNPDKFDFMNHAILRFKKTIFNSAPLCITNFINQIFGPLKSVVGINSRMVNFSAILDLLFLQKT